MANNSRKIQVDADGPFAPFARFLRDLDNIDEYLPHAVSRLVSYSELAFLAGAGIAEHFIPTAAWLVGKWVSGYTIEVIGVSRVTGTKKMISRADGVIG